MKGYVLTVERVMNASPEAIFDVLSNAGRHSSIDGSGMVQGTSSKVDESLVLGSKFGMSMKMGGIRTKPRAASSSSKSTGASHGRPVPPGRGVATWRDGSGVTSWSRPRAVRWCARAGISRRITSEYF